MSKKKKPPSADVLRRAKAARRRLGPTTKLTCLRCGAPLSKTAIKRVQPFCAKCAKAERAKGGDAMDVRLPGSFEHGKKAR